jgi:hypothetical protein
MKSTFSTDGWGHLRPHRPANYTTPLRKSGLIEYGAMVSEYRFEGESSGAYWSPDKHESGPYAVVTLALLPQDLPTSNKHMFVFAVVIALSRFGSLSGENAVYSKAITRHGTASSGVWTTIEPMNLTW